MQRSCRDPVSPENLTQEMCASQDTWEAVRIVASNIMGQFQRRWNEERPEPPSWRIDGGTDDPPTSLEYRRNPDRLHTRRRRS
ncbi:Dwil\GK15604-PA-like protein [Anopheles sinensis]|uniref:Dwil\GK15604-PA-like protein n=1 Tax=Anopheles sinensis TaxID=74873 RepID=A0A084VKU5_ANOSI|nr:Dwil\GK15604-PA-like protein [Anopheles sinensis]